MTIAQQPEQKGIEKEVQPGKPCAIGKEKPEVVHTMPQNGPDRHTVMKLTGLSENALEPTLTRYSYRLNGKVEQFDAKPAEIRAMFNRQRDPTRTAKFRGRMLAVEIPI